jgi:hypothetical protein
LSALLTSASASGNWLNTSALAHTSWCVGQRNSHGGVVGAQEWRIQCEGKLPLPRPSRALLGVCCHACMPHAAPGLWPHTSSHHTCDRISSSRRSSASILVIQEPVTWDVGCVCDVCVCDVCVMCVCVCDVCVMCV